MVLSWNTCIGYCLSVILFASHVANGATESPVVTTAAGKIQGTHLYLPDHDKLSYGFFNVPYVAPPVGDLRFQPLQPVEPWEGIRDATQQGSICPQNTTMLKNFFEVLYGLVQLEEDPSASEDCLYLNVYTPGLNGRRSVMVFIHGGGLSTGWASTYDMRVYAIREDIVGVTIEYRLGVLGWLSTADGAVEGNMGFKDQVAALQWVQKNIDRFGGDPNQVTIFGESAGSRSVSMHLLSPMSKGLFHRGIMQSGSMVGGAFQSSLVDTTSVVEKLGSLLDCPNNDLTAILECLHQKPAEDIVSGGGASPEELRTFLFIPTFGNECFPKLPSELLEKGEYNTDVDMILGVNDIEGFMFGKLMNPALLQPGFNSPQFRSSVTGIMGMQYPKDNDQWEAMTDAVMAVYADGKENDALRKAFAEFVGDFLVTNAMYHTAVGIAENSKKNVFFYEFNYRPSMSSNPEYVTTDHATELFFQFGTSYTDIALGYKVPKFNKDDTLMEGILMKYLVNFARTGNPNGEGQAKWPHFKDNGSYLVISTNPSIEKNFHTEHMNIWTKTLPDLAKKPGSHTEL